jgi:branched-chain amino acid transport system substrate-binding protein
MPSFHSVQRLPAVAAVACALVLGSCIAIGPDAPAGKPLHIGVDLPLTGTEARAAIPALNGIRFYVQQHPKLDGFDVTLTTADDAAGHAPSAHQGVTDVNRFLADPNLVAMIGPFDAMVARAEIPLANAAGLAIVSPATSSPCLTRDIFLPAMLNPARTEITCKEAGLPSAADLRPTHVNNFFRLTTTDDLQGPAVADYAFHTLHVLRAAVISDHEAYGQGLATAFTARLQRLGGTVVGRLDLDPKNPDATSFLKAMKGAGAQAVYFGGITRDSGCTIRSEMTSIFPPGEATPYLSGDGIAEDPSCIRDAGNNSDGIYAAAPVVDADSRATATQTIAAFKAAFGSTTDYGPYTIVAYDATAVLYNALHRAIQASGGQLPVRGNVTSQLSVTSGFAGATGTIGFDLAGDTTNRIVSVFEPTGTNPRAPWKLVSAVDYSSVLPY